MPAACPRLCPQGEQGIFSSVPSESVCEALLLLYYWGAFLLGAAGYSHSLPGLTLTTIAKEGAGYRSSLHSTPLHSTAPHPAPAPSPCLPLAEWAVFGRRLHTVPKECWAGDQSCCSKHPPYHALRGIGACVFTPANDAQRTNCFQEFVRN